MTAPKILFLYFYILYYIPFFKPLIFTLFTFLLILKLDLNFGLLLIGR